MVRFYTPNLDEACDALNMMSSMHSKSMTLSTRRCKHGFACRFAPNNMMKGYDSIAVSSI